MITSCFTISKPGFEPSTFIVCDDHRVFCRNGQLGFFLHTWRGCSRELMDHIAELALDGFTIKPATKKQTAKYAAYIAKNF